MIQKLIGTIHKNQVTKIYDDEGHFVCTFVIEYQGVDDKDQLVQQNVVADYPYKEASMTDLRVNKKNIVEKDG